MADGSRRLIRDVAVGDLVLAFDEAAGGTVVEVVTASLPHVDSLMFGEFSDGSSLLVTEDHLFYNAVTASWDELQSFDDGDSALLLGGGSAGLVGLDWSSAAEAVAYDLTVTNQHNFFVAASDTSDALLVHNQNTGLFCGVEFVDEVFDDGTTTVTRLAAVEATLDDATGLEVGRVLGLLDESDADEILAVLARLSGTGEVADFDRAARIAANLATNNGGLVAVRAIEADLLEEVLGGLHFADWS